MLFKLTWFETRSLIAGHQGCHPYILVYSNKRKVEIYLIASFVCSFPPPQGFHTRLLLREVEFFHERLEVEAALTGNKNIEIYVGGVIKCVESMRARRDLIFNANLRKL